METITTMAIFGGSILLFLIFIGILTALGDEHPGYALGFMFTCFMIAVGVISNLGP